MNNLIITVIAISLVSVISLIGIFYAGPMLSNNQYGAAAPAVIDLGQKIASAWGNYAADHRQANPGAPFPVNWTDLTTGGYLNSLPQVPPMPGSGVGVNNSTLYNISTQNQGYVIEDDKSVFWYIADVGRPSTAATYATNANGTVCLKILTSALSIQQTLIPRDANLANAAFIGAARGNGTYGCFYWKAGTNSTTSGLADNPTFPSTTVGGDYLFFYRLGN